MTDNAQPIASTRIEEIRDRLNGEAVALDALIATCEHSLHAAPIGCPYCKRDTRLRDLFRDAADLVASQGRRIAALEQGEWLPIESAPKDGTQIWTWDDSRGSNPTMWVDGDWWITYDDAIIQPTHWLPLPTGPQG